MGFLDFAIEAELAADYRRAIRYYMLLTKRGSMLDRVGIYQAVARCFEKLGSLVKAGHWRENAGRGYMKLSSRVMGRQERAYYAMVEFRGAIQDYAPHFLRHTATKGYLEALSICLAPGKEGYSHEMLFAAHLCTRIREFKKAAKLFADAAVQFKKEGQAALARESSDLAANYSARSGNPR